MTEQEATTLIRPLITGTAANNAQIDEAIQIAVSNGFGSVWESHWWKKRMLQDELTTTAGQAYVECPKDFDQGIAVSRQGDTRTLIRIVSPNRFYADHPSPSDDNVARPAEATLIWDKDTERYRLYLWPIPSDGFKLNIAYLAKAGSQMDNMSGKFASAVVAQAKAELGIIADSTAVAALDEAIEKDGGFPMIPGRMRNDSLRDLQNWITSGDFTRDTPDTYYWDVPY